MFNDYSILIQTVFNLMKKPNIQETDPSKDLLLKRLAVLRTNMRRYGVTYESLAAKAKCSVGTVFTALRNPEYYRTEVVKIAVDEVKAAKLSKQREMDDKSRIIESVLSSA